MLREIIKFIEEETGTKDLSVKAKKDNLAVFRGIYYRVARQYTLHSLEVISAELNQGHPMVLYWNANLESIIAHNIPLKILYKKVDDKFRPRIPEKVIIESPYAGLVERNVEYANLCLRDSLLRGEYPMASHILYTKALDDNNPEERELGIQAGLIWGLEASKTIVYTNYGISSEMLIGIEAAKKANREIVYRKIKNLRRQDIIIDAD